MRSADQNRVDVLPPRPSRLDPGPLLLVTIIGHSPLLEFAMMVIPGGNLSIPACSLTDVDVRCRRRSLSLILSRCQHVGLPPRPRVPPLAEREAEAEGAEDAEEHLG